MGLTIEAQEDTPFVGLDEGGKIHIEGRSLPENVSTFYKPVIEWVKNYINNPAGSTYIYIFLTYYNSSSFKCINDILYGLNEIRDQSEIRVDWVYEEDDNSIYETGTELQSQLDIPFNIIEAPVLEKKSKLVKVKNLITGNIIKVSSKYWEMIARTGHQKDFQLMDD